MNTDELLAIILKTSYGKAEVHRRIRAFRQYLEKQYFGTGDKKTLKQYLDTVELPDGDETAISAWGEDFFNYFNKDNAYSVTDELTESIKDLPLLNIYIPYQPDAAGMEKIGAWCRTNVDAKVLIEVHVDPAAFGGCAFAWNGVYHDYSLRHQLIRQLPAVRGVMDGFIKQG